MIATTRIDGFAVVYRQGTCDQDVLMHSFDNDIFFSNVPEYTPHPDDIIIDVGAHIGTFSMLASKKAPHGMVYAIEACKETFGLLKTNIQANCISNVSVHHFALSGEKGTTQLFHDTKSGNWGHSITKKMSDQSESVQTDTLEHFMSDNKINFCNFVKFNCEGAEFDILLKAPPSILQKIDTMLILYHLDLVDSNTDSELLQHLRRADFSTVVRKTEDGGIRGWIVAQNNHMQSPAVSITIPCYNHAHFLEDALKSLINQTFQNWEAVIVDDCSALGDPDDLVKKFNDRRISLVRHHKNKGLAASRNTGFGLSNAPLVLSLDADDALSDDFIEKTSIAIQKNIATNCVFTDFTLFGDKNFLWQNACKELDEMTTSQWIPGSGTLMKKTLWEDIGGYCEDDELKLGNEDWDFWLSAAQRNLVALHVEGPMYFYRRHSISLSNNLAYVDFKTRLFIYGRHKNIFDRTRNAKSFVTNGYINSARESWIRGEKTRAAILASLAFSCCSDGPHPNFQLVPSRIDSTLTAYITLLDTICDQYSIISFGCFIDHICSNNLTPENVDSYFHDWSNYEHIKNTISAQYNKYADKQLLVSILIPCYNYARYLKECLDSVIAQTYSHWEAIIVDDASTDNPEEIVDMFNDQRIRLVKHNVNKGAGATFNTAFYCSIGDLVVILSADDALDRAYIEKGVKLFQNEAELDVAFCDIQQFGNKTERWGLSVLTERDMTLKQWISGGGSIMRRKIWELGGGHYEDCELRIGNLDWDFWLSCIPFVKKVRHIPEPLYLYRNHGNSSLSNKLSLNDFSTRDFLYKRHRQLFDKHGTGNIFRADGYFRSARASWKAGQFFRAALLAAQAFKLSCNSTTMEPLTQQEIGMLEPMLIKLQNLLDSSCATDTPWIDDLRPWEMLGNMMLHASVTGGEAVSCMHSALHEPQSIDIVIRELCDKSILYASEIGRNEL